MMMLPHCQGKILRTIHTINIRFNVRVTFAEDSFFRRVGFDDNLPTVGGRSLDHLFEESKVILIPSQYLHKNPLQTYPLLLLDPPK